MKLLTRPVITIQSDGTLSANDLPDPSLVFLQNEVSGMVDVIRLGPIPGHALELDAWVNDEGAYSMPINPVATAFVSFAYGTNYPVFGPLVLTASNDQGETVPLPAWLAQELLAALSA